VKGRVKSIDGFVVGPEREVVLWLFVTRIINLRPSPSAPFLYVKITIICSLPSLKETDVQSHVAFTSFHPLQYRFNAFCTSSLWWTLQCLERPYFHFYGRYQNQVPKWSCVGIGLFEGGASRCLAFLLQGSTLRICYPGELFSIYQNIPFLPRAGVQYVSLVRIHVLVVRFSARHSHIFFLEATVPLQTTRNCMNIIFRRVRKVAKSDYELRHVRPFVHLHGTNRLPPEECSWKFKFEYFTKIRQENSSFIKICQE